MSLAHPLESSPECLLLAHACQILLSHIIAQMTLELGKNLAIFDSSGIHLPPPFRNCLVKVKHITPSSWKSCFANWIRRERLRSVRSQRPPEWSPRSTPT